MIQKHLQNIHNAWMMFAIILMTATHYEKETFNCV